MKNIKLAVLGGDRRQAALVGWLAAHGAYVSVFGIPPEFLPRGDNIKLCETLDTVLEDADAVILPLPVSGDGIFLNCQLCRTAEPPRISDIFMSVGHIPVLGGRFSPPLKKEADCLGIRIIDYFESEELMIRNSVLASEGAVSVAMNELDVSLCCSRCAVTGYGRLARTLAPMLKSLGSGVTVAARKSIDLAWAAAYGFETLKIGTLPDGKSTLTALCEGYDVVFNTVPYWLFDDALLSSFPGETLIVDLASAPGGADPAAVQRYGIRVIRALSLPGRYAPKSAGYLLGEYINEILKREGLGE